MRYKTIAVFILLLSACARKADPNLQIQVAVASTLAALPISTAAPISTPYPTSTPFDLKGLFCEYQFCIGHSNDVSFYDLQAINTNQANISNYSGGFLAAHNSNFNIFIQMIWQLAPGTSDPQFMLDLILDDVDSRVGTLDVKLIRDMNVIYTPITSTTTSILPFGAAGAWVCGERAFAWKVYTPQAESTQALFDMAMDRFQCNR